MSRLIEHAAVLALGAAIMPAPAHGASRSELEILERRSFDVGGLQVEAELGRLTVPEVRSDPDSAAVSLAFGRFRSANADPIAPVVYLAGGPGSSATAMAGNDAAMAAWRPLLELGDLILLDQRGTGLSRPRLVWTPEEPPPSNIFTSEDAARRAIRESCERTAEFLRAQGIDPRGYTSVESADDVDALRRALGLERISLFGFSYGTHLALATIARHGDHVERAILVGTEGLHQTFKHPGNADVALRKLALLVAADPVVGPEVPDLVALVRRVLDKLEREPMIVTVTDFRGEPASVAVGRFGLQMILRMDIGDRSDLVVFPRLLHSIDQGDPTVLQWFVQKRYGGMGPVNAMSFIMDGASGAPPGRWERINAEAATAILGNTMNFPHPHTNEIFGTPDLGEDYRRPVVSDVPVLFLSGTLDWNTPPYQAEMARWGFPDSYHLIVEGAGHEQILGTPGVGRAIVAFLRGEPVEVTRIELPPLRFVPLRGYDPDVTHPSVSLARELAAITRRDGIDAALEHYRSLRPASDRVAEREVNAWGYRLMGAGKLDDALRVFQMNADDFPESWNVWDSLAECHAEMGDRARAIELYEKSLEINPGNDNGRRMLQRLRGR